VPAKEEAKGEEEMRRRIGLGLAAALSVAGLLAQPTSAVEFSQKGNLRLAFAGSLSPRSLPRQGRAPIAVSISGTIATTDGTAPPALKTFQIAINKAGHFDFAGLPSCALHEIQPSSTVGARRACGASLVGEGTFSASVPIPEQSPYPSVGKLLAFNGEQAGKPVIFAHIYGNEPLPTSFTLALRVSRAKGRFGTVLSASMPEVASNVAFVTGISLKLDRTFTEGGQKRGYVSAGCPAPEGFTAASFALARARFAFADGRVLSSVLNRDCRVR
jgi:hypothetical protein